VVAAPGRLVFLGGQTAHDGHGAIQGETVVEQFDRAAANLVEALAGADARPEHLVSLQIFVTDVAAYRAVLSELADVYRRHFGHWYPAMALFEVTGLFDPAAQVELVGFAVAPDE
jgi:enamine deaminase RidA (YjgF/YER057c/UK114 family)